MSDSFYSDVKEKVERIPNVVPEGTLEVIMKRVRRRRLWRQTATYASGVAAAAILAFFFIGTRTENGGITPAPVTPVLSEVADKSPLFIEEMDTDTIEKVLTKKSVNLFESITPSVPEEETEDRETTPETESPKYEKPIEIAKEYYAHVQSFEPEHSFEQREKKE